MLYHSDNLKKYIQTFGAREHPILQELRLQTSRMPEAKMQIAPELGQTLGFFVKLINAKNILEIGTYTGYSSTTMALNSAEDAKIITCDHNKEWPKIAQKYWKLANVDHKIDLRIGKALTILDKLIQEQHQFDFIFIDADKNNYINYYEKSLLLVKKNGLIAIDNVLWKGKVADESEQETTTITIHKLNQLIVNDERVDMILLPIDDGLTIVQKR